MTSDTPNTENGLIRVQDSGEILEFEGECLGFVSTETPKEPRWLEIQLFRLTDGTGRYALHLNGRSVVYHSHLSQCNTGVPTPALSLIYDGVACPLCTPPLVWEDHGEFVGEPDRYELLVDPAMQFDLESDRHTVHVCDSAESVVARLKVPARRSQRVGGLSAPAKRLLDMVAPLDPEIAAFAQVVRRI